MLRLSGTIVCVPGDRLLDIVSAADVSQVKMKRAKETLQHREGSSG